MNEKYLKVSEMGVETGAPEKTWRVAEVPQAKDPLDKERERRELGVERAYTDALIDCGPSRNAKDAICGLLYLNKAANLIDGYDNWKMLSFYLLGKLDGRRFFNGSVEGH